MPIEHTDLLIAFLTSTLASTYGASAGGSALLVIPVIIFLGLSPQEAVATALLGYFGMNLMGVYRFGAANKVDVRLAFAVGTTMTIGTVAGALLLPSIPNGILEKLIGVFIITVLLLFLFGGNIGLHHRTMSTNMHVVGYMLSIVLGVYLATVMAGASTLTTYILVFFFGQTFLESAGTRKLVFMMTNTVAVIMLGFAGLIHVPMGIALIFGNATGCYIGAGYALKKGDNWVKWLFLVVTSLSALKLLF